MDDRTTAAVNLLTTLHDGVDGLRGGESFSEGHSRWVLNVKFALERFFGAKSDLLGSFMTLKWSLPDGTILHGWDIEAQIDTKRRAAYEAELSAARGLLAAAIDRLTMVGLDEAQRSAGHAVAASNRRVFISHGGHPPMLDKIERAVRTLGFDPVIVVSGPSHGKSTDDLVPEKMRECICAVVLATRDEQNPSSSYPRPNVLHEIGLAQEIMKDKIIYLKESGVDFPSNVAPKVWETFENHNADPVWDKLVRELRGWGFIP